MDSEQIRQQLRWLAPERPRKDRDLRDWKIAESAQHAGDVGVGHAGPPGDFPNGQRTKQLLKGTSHQVAEAPAGGPGNGGLRGAGGKQGKAGLREAGGLFPAVLAHRLRVSLIRKVLQPKSRIIRVAALTVVLWGVASLLSVAPEPCQPAAAIWRWTLKKEQRQSYVAAQVRKLMEISLSACDASQDAQDFETMKEGR